MKFKEYSQKPRTSLVIELSMKRGTQIKYTTSDNDSLYATVTLESGEVFKLYAASTWYTKFDLSQKLKIPEHRIKEGMDVWNIDFTDAKGNISTTPKSKGVALQLFAAIEKFMKDLERKHNPKGIEFSGYHKELSKVKLYRLLAKKIEKGGYQSFERGDYWVMIKKDLLI